MPFMKPNRAAPFDFDQIKADNALPRVVAMSVKIIKTGKDFKARCPFHDDRSPSLSLYQSIGGWRWHCFGCGVGGDVIDWVAKLNNTPAIDAAAMLSGRTVSTTLVTLATPAKPQSEGRIDEARKLWQDAGPIAQTPACSYLQSRGITSSPPDSLRFARLRFAGAVRPALVGLVTSADNEIVGVHRIFLNEDGRKADMPSGNVKFSLGSVKGGAIRLAPCGTEITVCAGLEDGLALQQLSGRAVWAATGDVMLAAMILPKTVLSVMVGIDADASGERAGREAAERFSSEGRRARILRPLDGYKDFNLELMGTANERTV